MSEEVSRGREPRAAEAERVGDWTRVDVDVVDAARPRMHLRLVVRTRDRLTPRDCLLLCPVKTMIDSKPNASFDEKLIKHIQDPTTEEESRCCQLSKLTD